MPETQESKANADLQAIVAMLILALLFFHLGAAWAGKSIYRDQHLGAALVYAKGEIDLLRPVIVGFNATGTPTPLEFPIWQGAVAILFRLFGSWYGWGNLFSLVCIFSSLWPLFQLGRRSLGDRGGWWVLIFYLSQPLVFLFSGCAGTDALSLSLLIWFVYLGINLVQEPGVIRFLLTLFLGLLTVLTKLPFFMVGGLICATVLIVSARTCLKAWLGLSGVGLISTVFFFFWSAYTDRCYASAEFPLVDLRFSQGSEWYFGSWNYRLSPFNWVRGGWRALNCLLGSFVLAPLVLVALFRSRSLPGKAWFFAGLLTTFVFTRLILHHHHYYLLFSPGVALLAAETVSHAETLLRSSSTFGKVSRFLIILAGVFLSLIQGLEGIHVKWYLDSYPSMVSQRVARYTSPGDRLLIQGGGWGGQVLMLADRQGLSIWNTAFLEKPENLRRTRELGFTKLVLIRPSPLLIAIQTAAAGKPIPRPPHDSNLTPVAAPWPAVYEDEDVLIREIQ